MTVPTRERIMDAGWQLFLQRGFTGTAVTQIEAAAGLSAGSGSFYRHFKSKEAMLQTLVDREVARVDAARDLSPEPSKAGGDARVALALAFQRRLANLRVMHPLIVLIQREREHLGPARERLRDLLVTRNVSVRSQQLQAWMDAGTIPKRDPEALATTIMCALTGYFLSIDYFDAPPGGIDEDVFIATLVDLVAGGTGP